MSSITSLAASQLRQAATLKEQIQKLEQKLGQILGSPAKSKVAAAPKKSIKVVAKTKIVAASVPKKKSKMSAAARAKISAAAKARWAKAKASGKEML